MAFLSSITLANNFGDEQTFDNVYIKVDSVDARKSGSTVYASYSKAKNDVVLTHSVFNFDADLESGPNHIKQAYLHLKSLPEFADAVDC